jgi:hypothetical protein
MKKLLLVCLFGGFLSSAAMAGDPYEDWLTLQNFRGMEIEIIRVASEKPLVATDETDAKVASILKELEAIEEETSDIEDSDDSS